MTFKTTMSYLQRTLLHEIRNGRNHTPGLVSVGSIILRVDHTETRDEGASGFDHSQAPGNMAIQL